MLGENYLGNLLEVNEENKNIFVVFLLNFCKLKIYIEEEINLLKGIFIDVFYKDGIFNWLSLFVFCLIYGNVFFYGLNVEFIDFQFKVVKMCLEI